MANAPMSSKQKIQYVLFDVDGVLVRNDEYFSVQYAREVGIKNEDMEPFFKGVFKECARGKDDLRRVVESYLPKWKWHGTAEEFLRHWFETEHHIDEGAVEYMQDLQKKGIDCAISSDQEKYRAQYVRETMGFGKFLDTAYFSCNIGYTKTDPEFWEFVYKDLSLKGKVDKKNVLVVDDDKEVIETVQSFGFQGYVYKELKDFKIFMELQHL